MMPAQEPPLPQLPQVLLLHENPDGLLDRFRTNVVKFPNKLAVTFLRSSSAQQSPPPPPPKADATTAAGAAGAAAGSGCEIQEQRTYQQLDEETTELAKALLVSSSLSPGDRVVLVYPPSIHFTIAFLACLKAGMIAVPIFPPNPLRRETIAMFAMICQAAQARVALTCKEYQYQKQLVQIKERITSMLQWKQSSQQSQRNTIDWPSDLEWIVTDGILITPKLSRPSTLLPSPSSSLPALAFLQFTSGSTSDPKGVMITRDNLAHNLSMIVSDLQADETTIVVSWLPMYHDMGLIGSLLGILYCGGSGYYLSPLTFLQRPMIWLEAVTKFRATHLQAPNFAFKLTARKFTPTITTTANIPLDLSSVRHIINAAEPVDTAGMQLFYDTFGKYGLSKVIYPTYGLAEHTVFVCSGGTQILNVDKTQLQVHGIVQEVVVENETTSSSNDIVSIVGCGYPARQGVDVQIVKDEMAVPEDVVGEIWINSPSKAAGYYGKDDETRYDFHAKLQNNNDDDDDENGGPEYLRTGDLGFLHQSELFICGRLKDLIIVGGRNYYPQDIEATAEATTDQIRPGCSAAFTIEPVASTEVVALIMELRETTLSPLSPSAGNNKDEALVRLAQQIRTAIQQEHGLGIASIMFLQKGTVPKTRSGKIARSWCRKAYHDGSLKVIHHESFQQHVEVPPREMEGGPVLNNPTTAATTTTATLSGGVRLTPEQVRSLPKDEICQRLIADLSRLAAVPPASIDKNVPMISMMDSLTISQFKGMVETIYHVRTLTDGYLFRESCTVAKLSEVVKLGYAPDDGGEHDDVADTAGVAMPGQATGLAGKLGCPPGVCCTIM